MKYISYKPVIVNKKHTIYVRAHHAIWLNKKTHSFQIFSLRPEGNTIEWETGQL